MNKKEEVTLQERLDAMEYETGSRMDMFDSAIRNLGGFEKSGGESSIKDKLKLAGNWISRNKEGLLVASVTVAVGVVAYALYKGQKQEMTPEAIGKVLPFKQVRSKEDHNYHWSLAMDKYDSDGNEITIYEVIEQLINEDYTQVDDNIIIFEEDDNNEKR